MMTGVLIGAGLVCIAAYGLGHYLFYTWTRGL